MNAVHQKLKSCGDCLKANVKDEGILYKMEDIIKNYKQGYRDAQLSLFDFYLSNASF